jgi:4'-phosphopantetheinyl transferase
MPPVHVLATTVAEARSAGVLPRYLAQLTAEEQARHARMRPDPRGDEFLVGRALAREALARHAPGAAAIFTAGAHGRLEVAGAGVSFNLSHAEGLVVCAVADSEVGVDVEKVDPSRTEPAIWEHHFAPAEVAALAALPEAERCERFFRYWTLKEAYIKARGLGLSSPLREFWFELDRAGPIRIVFAPTLDDQPERWHFAQQPLGPDHLLAVALRATAPIALSVERGLPRVQIF